MRFGIFAFFAVALFAMFMAAPATVPSSAAPDFVRVFINLPDFYNAEDAATIRSVGGQTRHFFAAERTISVEVPAQIVPLLERVPRFSFVRPVPLVSAIEDTLPWGIDQVDAERVWGGAENAVNVAPGANDGSGAVVAIVDTGIAAHSDLNIIGGASFVSGVSSYNDGHGHGTHVAGTVAARDNGSGVLGIAPGAGLLAVKVLSDSGSGYMDDVAAGIEWAAQNGADVINMSLSCTGSSSACNDPVMQSALQAATNAGVVIVAAAGNSGSGSNTVGWPAQDSRVIAVAATTSSNTRASFSSTGPAVEIAAPGNSIYSTYPGGYATMSGTSMASPHVAGAAALLKACGLSASQVRSVLQSTADDLGAAGRDNEYGYGLLDVDGAVATCGGGAVEPPPSGSGGGTISEDFESGGWSGGTGWSGGWSAVQEAENYGSSGPQQGSRHLRLRQDGAITRTFSLSGYSNATLTYWVKAYSWESGDGAAVQVSTNGSSWTTVASFANGFDDNTYKQQQVSLNQWAGQGTVYLRFLGQMSYTSDYFYVDSIVISGTSGGTSSNPTATPTNTPVTPTNTPVTPTNTPLPTSTNTPVPTSTNTPLPSSTPTNTPVPPTATNTPLTPPTATNTPLTPPTATNTPVPTATRTPTPVPTSTPPSCTWWQRLFGQC